MLYESSFNNSESASHPSRLPFAGECSEFLLILKVSNEKFRKSKILLNSESASHPSRLPFVGECSELCLEATLRNVQ